jgi:hypothetical protein
MILSKRTFLGARASTLTVDTGSAMTTTVVLGAKHRAPLSDHVLRTKLSAIIRGSHCPVLVVPAH